MYHFGNRFETSALKIKDDMRNFFKDLYELVSDELLDNDVNFFWHIEAVDQGRVGEIELEITLTDFEATLLDCRNSALVYFILLDTFFEKSWAFTC